VYGAWVHWWRLWRSSLLRADLGSLTTGRGLRKQSAERLPFFLSLWPSTISILRRFNKVFEERSRSRFDAFETIIGSFDNCAPVRAGRYHLLVRAEAGLHKPDKLMA